MVVSHLPGATVGLEEGANPLAHTGRELGEPFAGLSDDERDELSRLVRDGDQHIQSLLNDPPHVGLGRRLDMGQGSEVRIPTYIELLGSLCVGRVGRGGNTTSGCQGQLLRSVVRLFIFRMVLDIQ